MATPKTQRDNEHSAKLLNEICDRMRAVQEEALRSQTMLLAAAKALLSVETGEGALHNHVEEMFAFQSPFQRCQQFRDQASADFKAGDLKGAMAQTIAYQKCLMRPIQFQAEP